MRPSARAITLTVVSLAVVLVTTFLIWIGWDATVGDPQTTLDPLSENARSVNDVYTLITILAGAVMIGVLTLTLAFAVIFRERPGREAQQIHGNPRLEVFWTLIPVIIVVAIAVPSFQVIVDTTGDAPDDSLEVVAIGNQWWFEFEYPGLDVVTANELHIPVGRSVNVELRSEDVIHSFWVPQLSGKVDMVPGHNNRLWFTPEEAGTYLGQCAEFCGTSHANMRFRVIVQEQADFDAWVAAQAADSVETLSDEALAGRDAFLGTICSACHTIKGTSAAGVIGPDLTHIGSRQTIAAGILDNDFDNLVSWIQNPAREKPGATPEKDPRFMPAFEDILTDEQIEAIATYLLELE